MTKLDRSRLQIIEFLMRNPPGKGATLKDIAEHIGFTSPSVLVKLRGMVKDGLVAASSQAGRGPTYRAKPHFSATWIDPSRGMITAWSSETPVVWRYPLVGRVPDPTAQSIVRDFLAAADARGHLPAPAPDTTRGDPGREKGVTVCIFGSSARGDARPNSDVDVLVLQDDIARKRQFQDLAAELNLRAERKIDLKVVAHEDFPGISDALMTALRKECITVYSSTDEFIESFGGVRRQKTNA